MIKYDINGKEILGTTTPILIWCMGEQNLTLGKLIVNGKTYEIRVNENGKAQMT